MGQGKKRFRIEEYDSDEVAEFLTRAYKAHVERRAIEPHLTDELKEKIERVAKWLTMPKQKYGLMLYGSVGNGKTTMAKAIGSVIWATSNRPNPLKPASLRSISSTNIIRKAPDMEEFEDIKSEELLFIDDFGSEPSTTKIYGSEIFPIIEIIYHRYDKQLFTIISSNMFDEDIKQRYGERVFDRMEEMFDRIVFDEKSFRK